MYKFIEIVVDYGVVWVVFSWVHVGCLIFEGWVFWGWGPVGLFLGGGTFCFATLVGLV